MLLYLKNSVDHDRIGIDYAQFFPLLFAVLFVFLVYVQQQFLGHRARHLILVVKPTADAQVQRLPGLLLSGPFAEPGASAPESQFYNVVLHALRRILAAHFDDSLHVAALGSNEASGYLELLFVVYLNVEPTRVLHGIVVIVTLTWALSLVWLLIDGLLGLDTLVQGILTLGWRVETLRLNVLRLWLVKDISLLK